MPVERVEPSTLAGLVFETSAYTVPPHRLVVCSFLFETSPLWSRVCGLYNTAAVAGSQ